MDFGLGLILSFTDNATAGINNAVNSLQNLTSIAEGASSSLNQMASLSALSVVTGQLGDSFTSMGSSILSTLSQIVSEVNSTGQTLMYAENQLNALYKNSGKTGKEVIGQIQEYAKTSRFEFENLIPAVTSLKSVGIEAFDSITSSMGNSKNNLLDYASALASFAPQMRNAYGTGINAAIGALREYIAEGNEISLKRGVGLDITGLLGEDKGASIEERTRQVADLIEQLGMLEMVDVMKESPMTKLSNMGDTLFQFVGMVSSSGVYDAINGLIDIFAEFVSSIDDTRLESLANTVGKALTSLIKPLEWVAKKIVALADGFLNLVENNPALVKFITIGSAIAGVLLLLSGVALRAMSAFSGLSLMVLAFEGSFSKIGGLLKTGALSILSTLLPLVTTIGILALVWKSDFASIRTNTTNFVSSLVSSFKTARSAVSGSIGDLKMTIRELDTKDDFFSNLTLGLMKVMMAGEALLDAWGDYTLSEENFQKAKDLGILPLISAILDLKYRFEHFVKGFKEGWSEVGEAVKNFVLGITQNLDGTIFDSLLDGATKFLEKLSDNDPKAWEDLGKTIGDLAAKFLLAYSAVKLFSTALGFVTTVGKMVTSIAGAIGKIPALFSGLVTKVITPITSIPGKISTVLSGGLQRAFGSSISGLIPNVKILFAGVQDAIIGALTGIASAIGVPLSAIVAVIVLVISTVVAYATTHWEEFKEKVSSIWTNIKDEATKIWESIKEGLSRIWESLKGAVQPVVDAFNNLKTKFGEFITALGENETVQSLVGILSAIGETIVNIVVPAINGIVDFFSSAFQAIWNVVSTILSNIFNVIGTVLSGVMNFIGGILDIIVGLFTGNFDKVVQGVGTAFGSILTVASSILTAVWNVIASILSGIWNVFSSILSSILNVVNGAFQGIFSFIGSILNAVFTTVSNIWNKIKTVVDTVVSKLSDGIKEKWEGIKTAISDAINNAKDAVKGAIDKIKGFFDFDWELPKLKLPHLTITGGFSIAPPSVPKFSIDWYEKGGVFDSPSIIGVGENGQEAVMPLEKNTGWIGVLAGMLYDKIDNFVPANSTSTVNTTNQGNNNQHYLTRNNTTNQTIQGDTDNSVVFQTGAIQINIQNASEQEAIKLAKKVMEYIKRQKELDRMVHYA